MEILGLIELPIWLVSCIVLVLTIVIYTAYKKNTFRRLGIMTKPSGFLFGDFGEMKKKGLQVYDVSMVKMYGKVFGTFWANQPFIVISDPDMIKHITVKQFTQFPNRFRFTSKMKMAESAITVAEGNHWRYLRSTLSPCFTTGKLRKMNANLTNCLEKLQQNLQEQAKDNPNGFDITPLFKAYSLDVICSAGFGMDIDSQRDPDNAFVRHAQKTIESQFRSNPVVLLNSFFPDLPGLNLLKIRLFPSDSFDFFKEATSTQFAERKHTKSDYGDMLQTMINAHKEEGEDADRNTQSVEQMKQKGLTDDEVITNSVMFMLAGYDTTTSTLSWLAYDMAVQTECQEKLIQEIDREIGQETLTYDSVSKMRYLDMVVSETLRYHPIAAIMTRQATETVEVSGLTIPKGMGIIFPAMALHFMPEYWDEPGLYMPERFAPENKNNINEYTYMPFGLGPRNCIGMRLALTEVKMTLVSILQKYRIVRTEELMVPMEGNKAGLNKPDKPVSIKLQKR